MIQKHIIRTSERLSFKRCRRQWDWQSEDRQNWEPKKLSTNLLFGTAVHAGLQTFYNPKTWNTLDWERLEIHALRDFNLELRSLVDPQVYEEFYELKELGIGMIHGYVEFASKHDKFTPAMTEIEFEVPVTDRFGKQLFCHCHNWPCYYQGRWDVLLRDEDGRYWIMDHKTCASFVDSSYLELDEQVKSYCWAGQIQLGIRIEGALFNELRKALPHEPLILKKGDLSQNKAQNTTYDMYMEAIRKLGHHPSKYRDMLEYLRDNPKEYFRRTTCHYTRIELIHQGHQICDEVLDILGEPRIYPNPNRMTCSWCSFRNPCLQSNDGSDAQWVLREAFQQRVHGRKLIIPSETELP